MINSLTNLSLRVWRSTLSEQLEMARPGIVVTLKQIQIYYNQCDLIATNPVVKFVKIWLVQGLQTCYALQNALVYLFPPSSEWATLMIGDHWSFMNLPKGLSLHFSLMALAFFQFYKTMYLNIHQLTFHKTIYAILFDRTDQFDVRSRQTVRKTFLAILNVLQSLWLSMGMLA